MLENTKIVWWKKDMPEFKNRGWVLRVVKVPNSDIVLAEHAGKTLVKIGRHAASSVGQWVCEQDINYHVCTPDQL